VRGKVKLRHTKDLSSEQLDCVFARKDKIVGSLALWIPRGMRVYAIGDIHGRADLLVRQHALIEADFAANPVPIVNLVYLGDYIDRGPNSRGVLDILAQGVNDFVMRTLLRGNHEEMLLRFLEDHSVGPAWCQLGGLETLHSYGIDAEKVIKDGGYADLSARFRETLPSHHLTILSQLKTSFAIGNYFFCHAGVRPGIPLERQNERDLVWIREKFLDATGHFGKIVVHGHSPVDQPDFRKNRINIDTGAYATGKLTCLVLEGNAYRIMCT
jgi:serine/threonine protein phosphatase 1